MRDLNLLLLGAGYTARYIAKAFSSEAKSIYGTIRDSRKLNDLRKYGIEPLQFDSAQDSPISNRLREALKSATHVVSSIAPSAHPDHVDPVLHRLSVALQDTCAHASAPPWICYLSTVGVYGDTKGEWVNESAPCLTQTTRSLRRVEAEHAWQSFAANCNLSLAIMRLPGIYGPGRNALMNLQSRRARRIVKPGHVFNRVHVADIATAVRCAAQSDTTGIYNICDGAPSPSHTVVEFAAKLMQIDLPPVVQFDDVHLSEMARSFYSENKRVSNARSKSIPNMQYQYQNYQSGLTSLWRSGNWNQV